jgi:hypothetical protein
MRKDTQTRKLKKLLSENGLTLIEGDHRKILNQRGQAVYWTGGSPSCHYWANNVVRDLVKMGLLPAHAKKVKIV